MRAPSLALSNPLYRWLALDPQWTARPVAWRAMVAWQAGWGSLNNRLSRAIASQTPASELQDPLLILGPWRSGTTVMHELLTAASGCASPRTWQCMNACAFELSRNRAGGPSVVRPMDGLVVSGESPQEDEFALLALGAPSAYRAFWMPHRLPELHATLDPAYWLVHPQWLETWETFLLGVLRTTPNAQQPLILKSPNHTFRLQAILQRFPSTRVVWMMRSPAEVFESNRKMWRAMFKTHGITPIEAKVSDSLDWFLVQALDAVADTLVWCCDHLPPSQWVAIDQTILSIHPTETVAKAWKQLNPEQPLHRDALAVAVEGLIPVPKDREPLDIPGIALATLARLEAAQGRALRLTGLAGAAATH